MPYLLRPLPSALILGSFFLLAVPLAAVVLGPQGFMAPAFALYVLGLEVPHFLLTFVVYLSRENRQHFTSSPRNVFAFVLAPLLPIAFLALWFGLALDRRLLLATAGLSAVIRALDYLHLSRQSYGVLQLFKLKAGALPPWLRPVENGFFLSLALLLFASYLGNGRFDPSSAMTWAAVALSGALLAVLLSGYALAAARGAGRRQVALSLGYVAVQTGAALLAVWRLELYACTLAIHVIEYHVLMGRRVFDSPAPPEHDRALNFVRRHPLVLYGVLVALSVAWFLSWQAQDAFAAGPWGTRMLVHVFDGVFVFHYVLEMSIWKLRDPYFGRSVAPMFTG